MNEFLTIDYVLSFPGMIAICWLVVTAIKNLVDKAMNEPRTMWVVLITSMVLVLFKTVLEAMELEALTFVSISTLIVMWIINSLVVWFATMKAHEVIIER